MTMKKMSKTAYYDAKREEVTTELFRRAYWDPDVRMYSRMDCDRNIRGWAYNYKYGQKMGPKRIAEIGRLLGIPVWFPPTQIESPAAPYLWKKVARELQGTLLHDEGREMTRLIPPWEKVEK
jgi:hypothetical protein